ncbi:serine protease Hayan-like [Nymphalis io]|uniref:serine protease Hayan-like n=1 Tax=Inachis io TaxID=171585 RepID=UPI002167B1C5|nr:serine protease Hayan-like [Nymphalis io]
MSNDCCKDFKGWCKAFTRTETYLSVLQLVFLVIFILSLIFTILHFIACFKNKENSDIAEVIETSTSTTTTGEPIFEDISTEHLTSQTRTLAKEIKCTWTPSVKTTAVTHYYDSDLISSTSAKDQVLVVSNKTDKNTQKSGSSELNPSFQSWTPTEFSTDDNTEKSYDGEYVDEIKKGYLLALVKIKPPRDITFGCILTIVAKSWTVTAASCIEAIEEVDSLDSFVMVRGFGEKDEENIYIVSDILIHPLYQGVNATYDLAALKSEGSVARETNQIITLPTMVDYFSVTIGESLTILGYGKYRNLDKDPRSRRVRSVRVRRLPAPQCARGDAWAPRHLWGARGARRAACGAGALCAGALRARARPCHYCAGAPLLRRRVLLGVMSDNPQCGAACEPALYVNLALLRGWLDSTIYSD